MEFADYRARDAVALAEAVAADEVTAAELLDCALARLDAVNPRLNAVCIDLRREAREQLRELPADGAFPGVPFLIKDVIQDYRGVPSTAGCRAFRDARAPAHSDYVRRVLAAGMPIFGKTTTPELALKAITESLLWGITRNPWNPDHTPGGSSGGAAAAVAAGVVPMAGANDGGGSIRIPASHCGLFGLRPSRGRVPVTPAEDEHWEGASSDGVVSRSVRDSARMLDVLSGPGRGAPYHVAAPAAPFEDLAAREPGRLRIALSTRSPVGATVHPECIAAVERTGVLLEGLGHEVVSAETGVDGMLVARAYFTMYYGQVAATVDTALRAGARPADFELDTRTLALLGRALPAGDYVAMRRRWNLIGQQLASFFEDFDLFLTPTVAEPPPRIGAHTPPAALRTLQSAITALPTGRLLRATGALDKLFFESLASTPFTQLANLAGLPAMSVPMHWTADGLPVGSHFMAPWGEEGRLLALAAQLEAEQPWFGRLPEEGRG